MIDNYYKCCICDRLIGTKPTVNKGIKAGIIGYSRNKGTRYYHISCLDNLCNKNKTED